LFEKGDSVYQLSHISCQGESFYFCGNCPETVLRIGTLGCCTTALVFLGQSIDNLVYIPIDGLVAAPLADCQTWIHAIGGCFIVALPSTSALFFLRVRAVYFNDRIITAFFGFLLFVLFATSFLLPFSTTSAHVGPTQRCMVIKEKKRVAIPAVMNFTLDTLVFFAISLRIVSQSIGDHSFRAILTSFFRGDGLFSLSRSLLHSGQLYYWCVMTPFWRCTYFTNKSSAAPRSA
jgi:hypothetical protein